MATQTMRNPENYRPARGYSWPPFEPGNMKALSHGARSPRMVAPLAEAMLEHLELVAPWCSRPAFDMARYRWAQAEARALLLDAWIDEHGVLDPSSEGAVAMLKVEDSKLVKMRADLGLSPTALAKLLASLASVAAAGGDSQGLADVKAEGAAIVAARERQLKQGGGVDEGGGIEGEGG